MKDKEGFILLTKCFFKRCIQLDAKPTLCRHTQGYLTEVCVCHWKFTCGIYLSMPTLCHLTTPGSSDCCCQWRARYFFSHYGIMYSSNMAKTSQFQSLPLHRGSAFVFFGKRHCDQFVRDGSAQSIMPWTELGRTG